MSKQPDDPPSTPCAGGVAAALTRMRGEIRGLGETMWAARRSNELMDTVAEAESLKSTLDALLLDVVRELEATGAVKPVGWASTQAFFTSVAGGHKSTGPAVVRLAKAVDEPLLAQVGEAMRDGWLSTAKAQVITDAVDRLSGDPDIRTRGVQAMLASAKALDAAELAEVGRHLVSVVDPDGAEHREEKQLDREERGARLNRNLSIKGDGAGGAVIRGRCGSEDAAEIKSTLMARAAPQPAGRPNCHLDTCPVPGCNHDGRDPRDHGARMLDGLVDLCRDAKSVDVLPTCHGSVPRVSVTMSSDHLHHQTGHGTTETDEDLAPGRR